MNRSKCNYALSFIIVLCAACSVVHPVFAQAKRDTWEFKITPYAWLAGMSGELATLPGLPAADVDVDFYDDVFGNINGALMLVGEARKDRLGMVTDVVYTDIESDTTFPGENFSKVTSQTKSWIVSAAGFYRLMETDTAFVDCLAGIRYWSIDSELILSGGPAGAISADNKDDWFDPFIGAKGMTKLGASKFFINGGLLLGGFGAGSDFMWDVNANLGYQWTEMFSTTIGYRYLDVDYDEDGFLYDVAQDGLVLGLSWRF